MVNMITNAVTKEVSRTLSAQPTERAAFESRRERVTKKLANIVEAVENGISFPSLHTQIATRETELRQIDDELAVLRQPVDADITVIPTWVRHQLQDLVGLLAENPKRARAELQRLNIKFTVTPVRTEGKPFLRVEGSGDLYALCGIRDLPTTARASAQPSLPPDRSTRARSHPRSESDRKPSRRDGSTRGPRASLGCDKATDFLFEQHRDPQELNPLVHL